MKILKLLYRTDLMRRSGCVRSIFVLPVTLALVLTVSGFAASLLAPMVANAAVDVVQFDSPEHESLYRELIQELRCLVCQNQNLADSNAELAKDLRRKTREMVEQDKSRQDIVDYMVTRYGEFVLYRPPVSKKTFILWFSPLILFFFALGFLVWSRNRKTSDTKVFSQTELDKAHDLLELTPEEQPSATLSPEKSA